MKNFSFLATLLSTVLLSTSCKERSFNQGSTAIKSLDTSSIFKDEVAFKAALFEAAKKSTALFTDNDLQAFFGSIAGPAVRNDKFANFQLSFKPPFAWGVEKAARENVWMSTQGQSAIPVGGFVLVGKDIFPEGYYRLLGEKIPLSELMTKAPWFQWDEANNTWTARKGGGQKRLLEFMFSSRKDDGQFTMYRGAALPSAEPTVSRTDPYASGNPAGRELWFFSSPSINTAAIWAGPTILSSAMPRAELMAAATGAKPTIFVGIEYEYIEIAYLNSNQGPQLFAKDKRAKPLCFVKEKYNRDNHGLDATHVNFATAKAALENAVASGVQFCDEKILVGHTSGLVKNPSYPKRATIHTAAFLKDYPFKDAEKDEFASVCTIPAGTNMEYIESAAADKGQTWLKLGRLKAEWNCPRAFRATSVYFDAEKITVE